MSAFGVTRAGAGLLCTVILAACVGEIGAGGDPSGAGNGGPGESPPPGFAGAPSPMRRLTPAEYAGAIQDLTGEPAPADVETIDAHTYDFSTVGAGFVSISEHGIEQFVAAAGTVAHAALAKPASHQQIVGCSPTAADDACIRSFVQHFGRRVFRRPLTDDEIGRYTALVETNAALLGGVEPAIESVVSALLSSPSFLFRVEVGEPDPASGARRFTAYEIASRLSFLLVSSTPDDALLDAAEKGELTSTASIADHAKRLLATPRSHAALTRFFAEHFGLEGLDTLAKDPARYPHFSPTLGASMRGELDRLLEDVIFTRDADLRDLLDTKSTFVNAELAPIYGVPAPAGGVFAKVDLPAQGDRAGLFGISGLLAIQSHAVLTSPTLRGKFLRERLLCQSIAPPPNDADAAKFNAPSETRQTMRTALEAHLRGGCASCHTQMDPIGFGLEHFDAIGAYRADDLGLSLDSRSQLDGKAFDGPAQLGRILRDDPRVTECLATKLYTFANGHGPTKGEKVAVDALSASFRDGGYRMQALVVAAVTGPSFRFAGNPQ